MDRIECPFCKGSSEWLGSNYEGTATGDGGEMLIEYEFRWCPECGKEYVWTHRYKELSCELKE